VKLTKFAVWLAATSLFFTVGVLAYKLLKNMPASSEDVSVQNARITVVPKAEITVVCHDGVMYFAAIWNHGVRAATGPVIDKETLQPKRCVSQQGN
jgi:hypothetical protein